MSMENIVELFSKRAAEGESLPRDAENSSTKSLVEREESVKSEKCVFESLRESEAGITEYLNKTGGFSAVVKERFSDFQVHEIDLDGNVVTLSNFDMPIIPEPTIDVSDEILQASVWDQLKNLYDGKVNCVEIDVTECDKDKRRSIHKLIKAKYKKIFTTNTVNKVTDIEKKLIVVSVSKDSRDGWPYECGHYLHFVLFKINIDTMDAINQIASKLSTKASNFTYAGTKDKRGKTSQQVSMWHLKPERLNSLNNCLKHIKLGNFSYKSKPLKLGDLKGNHFKIALRNVTADNEIIDHAFESLKANGFINYFGLQRFGNSPDVPTFKIGKSLVKGDFKNVIELILKPKTEKPGKDELEKAKKIWWDTKDAKKAYDSLKSKSKTHEGKLLQGLAKHGSNAYVNALDFIPRNVRLLYLHSYQSLLWNKIVSKRIKEFGSTVLEGDLISIKSDEVQNDTRNVCTSESEKELVRCITSEEVESYQISDVIHPLPGYDVTYPNNAVGTWYEELLKEEGLTSEEFKQRVKGYSLRGTYRNIVKKVKDLSWDIVYYSKPEDDLILSDLDVINKNFSSYYSKGVGEFKAVVMSFSLDSSTYATMAIREVLKINISSSYQASLNSYSNKRKLMVEDGEDNETENKKMKT